MDEALLRPRLDPRTRLIIGNIQENARSFPRRSGHTAHRLCRRRRGPLFVDDAGASALHTAGRPHADRTMLYCDDVDMIINHHHQPPVRQ
jgi:hypothetical protein